MGIIKYLRWKLMKPRSGREAVGIVDGEGENESCSGNDDDGDVVKRYSWEEIEKLTENLAVVVGSGGFSTVYLARFPGGGLGAVKVNYGSERLKQVFKEELEILVKVRHDNIVRLIGYCDQGADGAGALVFEYVSNGTLQDKLHGGGGSLPWWARARIAFQLAQSLDYLHHKCCLHIIHGDLKSSNILIDQHLNSKLCDFGVAKLGFSSIVTPPSSSSSRSRHRGLNNMVMVGSPGYTDPYYLKTGMASKMNDIYAFGIILLELVTGMQPFCPDRGQLLSAVAAPALHNLNLSTQQQLVAEFVDPQLKANFDLEEVRAILQLAKLCLNHSPVLRPSASRVLQIIKDNIPSVSPSSSFSTDRKKKSK